MVSWFGIAKIMCYPLKIRCEVLSVLSVPVRCDEMRERDRKRVNKPHLKSSIARPALQRERLRELQAGRLFLLASDEKGLAILVSPSSGHPFGNAPFQRRSIRIGTVGSTINLLPFPGHLDDRWLGIGTGTFFSLLNKCLLMVILIAETPTPTKMCKKEW